MKERKIVIHEIPVSALAAEFFVNRTYQFDKEHKRIGFVN